MSIGQFMPSQVLDSNEDRNSHLPQNSQSYIHVSPSKVPQSQSKDAYSDKDYTEDVSKFIVQRDMMNDTGTYDSSVM